MALRIAIDTNMYADFTRGLEAAVRPIQTAREVCMPFIVLAELRAGFKYGSYERENEINLGRFLSANRVSVLFPDEATTRFYAEVYAHLRREGTPLPTNDIWIAALAIQHDLVLLTRCPLRSRAATVADVIHRGYVRTCYAFATTFSRAARLRCNSA